MSNHLYDFDLQYDVPTLCGVDEAGRGPLCGPVCCAAVVLDYSKPEIAVKDSKKLSHKKREELYEQIVEQCIAYNVVMIHSEVIDEINILNATMLGMKQAMEGLTIVPSLCLIDGNKTPNDCNLLMSAVVKGDDKSATIAAASIIAKVTRDRYMQALHEAYPQYCLDRHKGYGTALHYQMLREHGIQEFYRKSFLKKFLNEQN